MVFGREVEDEDVDDGSGLDVSVELSETSRTLETPETPETPIFSSLLDQKPPIFWSISEVGAVFVFGSETPVFLYQYAKELWSEDKEFARRRQCQKGFFG